MLPAEITFPLPLDGNSKEGPGSLLKQNRNQPGPSSTLPFPTSFIRQATGFGEA